MIQVALVVASRLVPEGVPPPSPSLHSLSGLYSLAHMHNLLVLRDASYYGLKN